MAYAFLSKTAKPNPSYFTNWERNLLSLIHELSGPLTAAELNLDSYLAYADSPSLKLLKANLKLMEDYLMNARQNIKHQPIPGRSFAVNAQLDNLINNLWPLASQRDVTIELNNASDCMVYGNPTRFKQIISCFIRNAIEAYDNCRHENKTVTIGHHHETGYLVIAIRDHGSGITNEDRQNIFKPYFSTKHNSSGLGLGLSLAAESISKDFGGQVKVESDKLSGTLFNLYFQG